MPITSAILLAAGYGSRLSSIAPSKPLCPVAGASLLDHALQRLHQAGMTRVIVVLGHEAGRVELHLAARPRPLAIETVRLSDWSLPNGVSALAAAPLLDGPALLAMCDHLVDPALYARVAQAGAGAGLTLGIDRRLDHAWIDPDDVTRVATRDGAIVAIGKGLAAYDCFDTGVFAVDRPFFDVLGTLHAPSISDAVTALAVQGCAHTVNCSDIAWIDVDDPRSLAQAEAWLAAA
ncbi:1L-myo-inositol 1-phosphate cytidylyltransferase [Sphingomonas guangdongensis]|uniref:1L-myo-inositol 1-phosphate cytidylyltransferase n=1 Tax=Sphingomonas guangdongensis TaxID=1141890 RepID=A0A285R1F0_9SPHN|nr:NTP transferase domain-containing protein [Sphingomonas guangdongensis]SOB87921.1 1L-myo-inositol 1-phosphate cytidylyltransferase [Sphingomonas guangdongensis]